VTAEIHSIAPVVNRFGYAAYLRIGFNDDGCDIGPPRQFKGSGQASGACSSYDCSFPRFIGVGHYMGQSSRATLAEWDRWCDGRHIAGGADLTLRQS